MNKEEIEELKRLLFQDRLTQYGKRKLVKYLEQLEFKVKANKKEHEYDVEMIDNVKGEAVKLYKEINRLNAILDKVTDLIKNKTINISGFECIAVEDLQDIIEEKIINIK